MYKFEPFRIMEEKCFTSMLEYHSYMHEMWNNGDTHLKEIEKLSGCAVIIRYDNEIFCLFNYGNKDNYVHTSHNRTLVHCRVFDRIYTARCYVEEYAGIIAIVVGDIPIVIDKDADVLTGSESCVIEDLVSGNCKHLTELFDEMFMLEIFSYNELLINLQLFDQRILSQVSTVNMIHEGIGTVVDLGNLWQIYFRNTDQMFTIDKNSGDAFLEGIEISGYVEEVGDGEDVYHPTYIEHYCGFTSVIAGDHILIWYDEDVKSEVPEDVPI